jgi:hypothetical protein
MIRARASPVVEQWAEGRDHEVQGPGDQQRAVPERPVLTHAADAGRERLRQE